jgi:hypothetical protein
MLAYVFWHWPGAGVNTGPYEKSLRDFHHALAQTKPAGFLHSIVFRLSGAPWLATSGPAYEEWYLVDGSGGLDPLNEGAVSGLCKEPHDRAARQAGGGTAGLYRLRAGEPKVEDSSLAWWLAKPAGVRYEDFYAQLAPWTRQPGVSLWGRQMALGPTPEFTLRSPAPLDLPNALEAVRFELMPLWR